MEQTRKVTAYHESGHAVACYLLGKHFTSISISPDPSSSGRTVSDPLLINGHDDGDQSLMDREIIILLSGYEAGKRINKSSGNHDDLEVVYNIFAYMYQQEDAQALLKTNREASEHYQQLQQQTQMLIDNNWQAVESLAKVLIEKRTLTGEEAVDIIKGSL